MDKYSKAWAICQELELGSNSQFPDLMSMDIGEFLQVINSFALIKRKMIQDLCISGELDRESIHAQGLTDAEAKIFFGEKLYKKMGKHMDGITISQGEDGLVRIPERDLYRAYRNTFKKYGGEWD